MVWGLFSDDPLSGEDKYYIFGKGTYKVGRKGCDVIVNKDKGVSRVHAEITINVVTALNHRRKRSSVNSVQIRVRDCSKYGTFIKRGTGLKEKVHEFPNKEATLEDGDLVSFGTGNATYRFCFVPLIFFACQLESFQGNTVLQEKIASLGASLTSSWSTECTHVLVDEFKPVSEDVLDAVVAEKPFVNYNWVELIAGMNIATEIPSCTPYAPTLLLHGVSVRVADPKSREHCLSGYIFVLDSIHKYKVKERLQSLLEIVGAKAIPAEGFDPSIQGSVEKEKDNIICVVPSGLVETSKSFDIPSSLRSVSEMDLVCATLSGRLDPSALVSQPVLVSSSCSTDETVVADSETEAEITSVQKCTSINKIEPIDYEDSAKISSQKVEPIRPADEVEMTVHSVQPKKEDSKILLTHDADSRSKVSYLTSSTDRADVKTTREHTSDDSAGGNSDIIYSQDLIVRPSILPSSVHSSRSSGVLNFKRFKKTGTESGNSFSNLIPFSKYPYRDSDNGCEDVVASVKEEKKRKRMETVAEELFNNDKEKRGAGYSLHALLSRG